MPDLSWNKLTCIGTIHNPRFTDGPQLFARLRVLTQKYPLLAPDITRPLRGEGWIGQGKQHLFHAEIFA